MMAPTTVWVAVVRDPGGRVIAVDTYADQARAVAETERYHAADGVTFEYSMELEGGHYWAETDYCLIDIFETIMDRNFWEV